MAFKGAHFAYMSAKNTFTPLPMRIALAGVLLIPVIFAGFYLSAFLDPYSHLEEVPVAVVNEDQGATVNGEYRNAGKEVVQKLKDSDEGLGWNFVTAEEAEEGIEQGMYYMSCTIPEDFTEQIASADTTNPESAQITITYDESSNMLASQIGQTAWTRMTKQVNEAVIEEYFGTVFETIDDGGEQLQAAVDGALELESGMVTAQSGSNTITTNLYKLVDGSSELQAGLAQVESGANQISTGTQELSDKASVLPAATQQLTDGANAALAGAQQIQAGTGALDAGMKAAVMGAQSAQAGAAKLYNGLTEMKKGLENASTSATKLSAGVSQISGTLEGVASDIGSLQPTLTKAGTAMKEGGTALGTGAKALSSITTPLASAKTSLESASTNMTSISTNLESASTSIADADTQIQTAASTISDVNDNINAATTSLNAALAVADLPPEAQAAINTALGNLNTASGTVSNASLSAQQASSSIATASSSISSAETTITSATTNIGSASLSISAAVGNVAEAAKSASSNAKALQEAGSDFEAATSTISQALSPTSLNDMKTKLGTLEQGANDLATGIDKANASVGSDNDPETLIGGTKSLRDGLAQLVGNENGGLTKAASSTGKLNTGVNALVGSNSTGLIALANGMGQLNGTAGPLIEGVNKLNAGAHALAAAIPAAASGADQISNGAEQLANGSASLTEGLETAASGASQLADGLETAANKMSYGPDQITAKKTMMSKPVTMSEDYYTTVKNYGTGFGPLFIGLGIWVGAIFNCFLFRSLNTRLALSGVNPVIVALAGFLPMAGFSIASTVISMAFVQFFLNAQIGNVVGYYAMGILAALCFTSIIQFLVAAAGFPGRFIAVVLLTLQLTSSSGTFPIVMEPDFFGAISPFFPMTYIVEGMRQLMTGVNYGTALYDGIIVAGFAVVFFVLTALVAKRKQMVSITDIHPLLDI